MTCDTFTSARSCETRVNCAIAIRAAIEEVAGLFEAETGVRIALTLDTNPRIAHRIMQGAAFDVVIVNPHLIDDLIRAGVAVRSRSRVGSSPIGIGVKAGMPSIDSSSVAAFVRLLENARSIGYGVDGTSGRRLLEILDRLGVAGAVRPKLVPLAGGAAGRAVADGLVEVAIVPVSTILDAAPAATVAGVVPAALGNRIDFDAAVGASARDPAAAEAFVAFLASARCDEMLARRGVERQASA